MEAGKWRPEATFALLALAFLFWVGGCSDDTPMEPPGGSAVTTVEIVPDSIVWTVDRQLGLTVELRGSSGETLHDRAVAWSVADPSIATVDPSSGVLTGVAAGATVVAAASEGVSDEAVVIVEPLAAFDRTLTPEDIAAGYVLGQVAIAYVGGEVSEATLLAINTDYELSSQTYLPGAGVYVATSGADADSTRELVAQIDADPRVASASLDILAQSSTIPAEFVPVAEGGKQYFLEQSGVDVFWRRSSQAAPGQGWTIAVLDNGFDLTGQDLIGPTKTVGEAFVSAFTAQVLKGAAWNPVLAKNRHGTLIASVALGSSNGIPNVGAESVGVAPGATLMPVRVDGSGDFHTRLTALANAIAYAAANGADVINISLEAAPTPENLQAAQDILTSAVTQAISAGVEIVVSSGNCGDPASTSALCMPPWSDVNVFGQVHPEIWVVGASHQNGWQRSSFSSKGASLDLVAPGWRICTEKAYPDCVFGTSIAAPIVAGLLVLYRTDPSLPPSDQILRNAIDLGAPGRDDEFGYGRAVIGIGLDRLQPSAANAGVSVPFTLIGRNFHSGADLRVNGTSIPAQSVSVTHDTIRFDYIPPSTEDSVAVVVHNPAPSNLVSDTLWLRNWDVSRIDIVPAPEETQFSDVNDNGQVIGGFTDASGDRRAFSWTEAGGLVQLQTLPGGTQDGGNAINNKGQITGSVHAANGQFEVVIWESATSAPQVIPGFGSASDINENGEVVGVVGANGFFWSPQPQPNGTRTTILPLAGDELATPVSVNDAGQVVGWSSGGAAGQRAFIWTADSGSVALGGGATHAGVINNAGEVLGLRSVNGQQVAFRMSPAGVFTDLVLPGGGGFNPFDMNDDGDVVGVGDSSNALLWRQGGAPEPVGGGIGSIAWTLNNRSANPHMVGVTQGDLSGQDGISAWLLVYR